MREGGAVSLAVVGVLHRNADGSDRRREISWCAAGEPVTLQLEPNNPADERAVAVYSARGIQLGYLTAERAAYIGGLIRSGRDHQAIFQAPAQFGAWIRMAFDGAVPVVPDQHRALAPDRDIGLDQDWPGDDWHERQEHW